MPLTGYEETSVVEVGAVLDDSPADAEEVYLRTIAYSERSIAAVAAKRAGGAAAGSLPAVIVHDNHGGTIVGNPSFSQDPTPVVAFTVFRDDLNSVTDPADGVYLPQGFYLGGGYIDFVPDGGFPTPTGKIAAWVTADAAGGSQYPEGDLGYDDLSRDISELQNFVPVPTRAFSVAGPRTYFYMQVDYENGAEQFTWVKWVFWAAKIA